MNHHSCNMGTHRLEFKTANSGLPDIQKLDTYWKRFIRGGFTSRNCAGAVTNPQATCNRDDEKISSRTERKL